MQDESKAVLISGASGLVGSALAKQLRASGYRVVRLVRGPVKDPTAEIRWDPKAGTLDPMNLEGLTAVVNLAGKGIADGRWTAGVRQEIRDSRILGTRQISEAIAALDAERPTLINASAIGFYGDRGQEVLDESSNSGEGFLAETTIAWEAATEAAADSGARVVLLRTGMVLSRNGGALAKMLTPFRLGVGGRLGDGRQIVSWITLVDLVASIQFALEHPELAGPVNAVAPNPVTNLEFTKELGRQLSRPTVLPLPRLAIELLMGDMGRELLLSSTHVIPQRLEDAGFRFGHPTLAEGLAAVLQSAD